MSYLIGAVAILHEASVIPAVFPVKLTDLQGSIGMEGHPRGWLDYLTPLLPDNRRLGLAHALAWQRHILLPRYNKRGAERIYGGANCKRKPSELLSSYTRNNRSSKLAFINRAGRTRRKRFPTGKI